MSPVREHEIMLQLRLGDRRHTQVSIKLTNPCLLAPQPKGLHKLIYPFSYLTVILMLLLWPIRLRYTLSLLVRLRGEKRRNKSLMGWQFPLFSNCTQIQWKHSTAAACVQWLQSWATVENLMTDRCWSLLKISPSVFVEHSYKEAPLCSAVLYSVQECNRNAVCITFIYHYHHHYHDVLSVWQSACNMNDNSSYWSCFSMKQIIIAGRERQLGFKKAPDVAKTAFKLLFVVSWSLQHTEKLQQSTASPELVA